MRDCRLESAAPSGEDPHTGDIQGCDTETLLTSLFSFQVLPIIALRSLMCRHAFKVSDVR